MKKLLLLIACRSVLAAKTQVSSGLINHYTFEEVDSKDKRGSFNEINNFAVAE
jgi:hypothetical protein